MKKRLINIKLFKLDNAFTAVFMVWIVMFILSTILYVFSPKSQIASYSVTVFYSIWVALSLYYALRNGGLSSIGLPGKRWLVAVIMGVIIGMMSIIGNNNTPEFRNATLTRIPILSLLTLIITGSAAAFSEVMMIMGYYHFIIEKRCGMIISIIITSVTWTVFHLLLLFSPGSIPSTSGGIQNFIVGILFGSLIITITTSITKSILTAFIVNLMSNIFINWFRISVSPQDVLIADNSFPVIGIILIIMYIVGIVYVNKKATANNVVK